MWSIMELVRKIELFLKKKGMEKGKGEEDCIVHTNLQLRQGRYFNINIMLNHYTEKSQ